MKIGVLTYHCVPNFGAQLQTISTIGCLMKMGHEPVVLNWYPIELEEMYAKRIPASQVNIHNKFMNENIPVSKVCRTDQELASVIDNLELDAIFEGSDALFKYIPLKKRTFISKRKLRLVHLNTSPVDRLEDNSFFGSYFKYLKKRIPLVGFSISSQNCPYTLMNAKEREMMHSAFSLFKAISVRDSWTKGMVNSLNPERSEVRITPDPVFSFNSNCYINIPSKQEVLDKYNLPDNYVLLSFRTSFLSTEYVQNLASYLKAKSLIPVAFPMPEGLKDFGLEHKIDIPLSPIEWYALIIHSKGYIGERMHPIVVCVHNSVPFYCFDEYGISTRKFLFFRDYNKSSSKTYHILHKAGLEKFMCSYKEKKTIPSPQDAVNVFLGFDKKQCQAFATSYEQEYKDGMEYIISNIDK